METIFNLTDLELILDMTLLRINLAVDDEEFEQLKELESKIDKILDVG